MISPHLTEANLVDEAAAAQKLALMPGERARVRSAGEILSTLDSSGSLDGMPFMPEMLKYCGRTYEVAQRADKTCAGDGVVRRMHDTVHLNGVRCDGAAHAGCEAACLMYWKEAWLERIDPDAADEPESEPSSDAGSSQTLLQMLIPATQTDPDPATGEPRYRCQATEIPNASSVLRFRDADQFLRDLRNWSLVKIVRGLAIEVFNLWQSFSKRHLPKALVYAEGRPYPFIQGPHERGKTPSGKLDLQPGELVRVKSKEEIEATLDHTNHNRGLSFDGEMVRYCGRQARVRARVNRLVEESTGELIEIKSDCIILEGVVCAADYHRFCPRGIYPYWRELWLERVEESSRVDAAPCPAAEGGCGP